MYNISYHIDEGVRNYFNFSQKKDKYLLQLSNSSLGCIFLLLDKPENTLWMVMM